MAENPRIAMLLAALDEAYDHKSWHGTNLRGSVRGIGVEEALWRPQPGRHNIWELMLHAAYWKYVVRRRISGAKRGSFVLKGSDYFPRVVAIPQTWAEDLLVLENEHRELRATVASFDAAKLDRELGSKLTYAAIIRGGAAHDLYHAGQIQLLKRMWSES